MSTILEDLSELALVEAIEKAAVEGYVAWAAWPGLELHEEPDLLWTITDIPFPLFNAVLRARISDKPEERIEAVLTTARKRKVPMVWFVTPLTQPSNLWSYLISRDFAFAGVTGMAADLLCLEEDLPRPRALTIEEVLDAETLRIWCNVMAPVFKLPDFAVKAWFEIHNTLGFKGPWRHYLARLEGRPVATSSLFLGSSAAAMANVATLPKFRGRRIGAAVTLEALREARRRGYRIGTLCASEMGEGVYRRLGFREVCRMGMYFWEESNYAGMRAMHE